MADITKCTGLDCPFKDHCYRYTAEKGHYQTYFANPPIKDGKCDMYWGENAQSIWQQLQNIINGKEMP